MAQAGQVAAAFERVGRPTVMVEIETAGDHRAPDTAWGEGAFVTAIERALLAGRVDVAVHSAKDVPTDEDERLRIVAYLPRADARDALVVAQGGGARTIDSLPAGARIGTDSPRRTGFILARRPDLQVHPIHGNVDTRLLRLDEGATDALILATAGLSRLEREDRIAEHLDVAVIPPAPGQGAIAIQVRADDRALAAIGREIDHSETRQAVEIERDFLRRSGGGCRAPIGAHAVVSGDRVRVLGGYALPDGSAVAIERVEGALTDRHRLIDELVERLSTSVPGVAVRPGRRTPSRPSTAEHASGHAAEDRPPRLLVTRPEARAGNLLAALATRGVASVLVPAIEIQPVPVSELDLMAQEISGYAWIVVTSSSGAVLILDGIQHWAADTGSARWAAVGEATAEVLRQRGVVDIWRPSRSRGDRIATELPVAPGDRVFLARANIGDPGLPDGLRARGAIVEEVAVYRTIEGPWSSRATLRAALDRPLDAVLFASGSAVRGLLALADPDATQAILAVPAICIGPRTASVAVEHGFHVIGESTMQRADALAALAADLLRPAPGVLS